MSRAILSNFFEVNSKSLTVAIGSVACTFSDNLSRSFSEKVQPTILKGIVGVFVFKNSKRGYGGMFASAKAN